MLSKLNRLPGYLIPRVLNSKTTYHTPFFGLKVLESSHSSPRLGFIISTKIAQKAVDRNKIKRLLCQAIQPYLKTLKPHLDLLFLAKHPLKNQTLKQIDSALPPLLQKSNLLVNEKPGS